MTVLVTQILRASTSAADVGEARWAEMLAEHDRVVRDCVGRFRGKPIEVTSEGVRVRFDDAGRARACARELAFLLRGVGINIGVELHLEEEQT